MNANSLLAKDYENETAFRLQKYKPKQSQFQRQKLAEIIFSAGSVSFFGAILVIAHALLLSIIPFLS